MPKITLGFSQLFSIWVPIARTFFMIGITLVHAFPPILFTGEDSSRGRGHTKRMPGRDTGKNPHVDEVEETLDPSQPRRKPRFPPTKKTLGRKEKTAS